MDTKSYQEEIRRIKTEEYEYMSELRVCKDPICKEAIAKLLTRLLQKRLLLKNTFFGILYGRGAVVTFNPTEQQKKFFGDTLTKMDVKELTGLHQGKWATQGTSIPSSRETFEENLK